MVTNDRRRDAVPLWETAALQPPVTGQQTLSGRDLQHLLSELERLRPEAGNARLENHSVSAQQVQDTAVDVKRKQEAGGKRCSITGGRINESPVHPRG